MAQHLSVLAFASLATGAIFFAEFTQSFLDLPEPWFAVCEAVLVLLSAVFYLVLALRSYQLRSELAVVRMGFFVEVFGAYLLAGVVGILAGSRFHGTALIGISFGFIILGSSALCVSLELIGVPLRRYFRHWFVRYVNEQVEFIKAILFVDKITGITRKLSNWLKKRS